jgi:hypothetical protein
LFNLFGGIIVKKIMIFSLLSLISGAIAQQGVIKSMKSDQVNSENAQEITYTIIISHDKQYDASRWKELVDNTLEVVKKVQTGERGGSAERMVRGLSEAIELVGTAKGNDGIHGEMKISISDGMEEEKQEIKRNGDICPCISKGICSCTAASNCCSSPEQIRAACNAACAKSGCNAAQCAQIGCVKSKNK